jgi:hypothetical protein
MAIIYKSTNAAAPVMTGADKTSIVRVLRACLVDGYGDKPGAGWVMPFVNADGTKAAFKNAGTGFYLRIDDSVSGNNFKCASFESMSDIDTGVNVIASEYSDRGRASLNNNAIPWVVAANDKFVFLVIYTGYSLYPENPASTQTVSLFFGDFAPNRNGDAFCCMSSGSSLSNNSIFGWLNNNIYIARNYDNVVGGVAAKMLIPFASGFGYSNEVYSNNANLIVSRVMIIEGSNIIRGFLGECLAPLQKIPFYNGETVSIGEKSYEAITWVFSSSYIYQLLFEVTG